jgi:hypothetical protein
VPTVLKSGSLNLLGPSGPVQACNGTSLPISYKEELDTDNKLSNYLKITGILNDMFRPQKTLKKTRIKLYNTLALPVLLYGSKTWSIKARDARRITAAEMKYMRKTAEYIRPDYKTNTQIAKEFKKNTNFRQITGLYEKLDITCK